MTSEIQLSPAYTTEFLADVVDGLSGEVDEKHIPSRYLYDERGCELFEAICETPEYYPTRTELSIMRRDVRAMAELCGPRCRLVELGSGASIKTQLLLDELVDPAAYIPVDIAPEYLVPSVRELSSRYPDLRIEPVCANFAEPFEISQDTKCERTVIYFPGSTIGNFTRPAAVELLARMREMAGRGGGILLGVDMKKDIEVVEAAYNDQTGVTAQFTTNLLRRLQRDLEAEVAVEGFEHLARYNSIEGRIEIYLRSSADQTIDVGGHTFAIESGELINTEYSYKYSLNDVQSTAHAAGLSLTHAWLDEQNWFGVLFLSSGDQQED